MQIGFDVSLISQAIQEGFPKPALDLDLYNNSVLDPRITFTRPDAATCATSFDSDGRLSLKAANIPRFDYDPSTANGTTGPELVSNGDFSSGTTGWSLTDAVVTDGTLVCGYGVSTLYNQQTVPVTQGKTYQITYTISALNGIGGSGVSFTASGGAFVGAHRTTTGTFSESIVASSSSLISLGIRARGSGINSAVIDNISVREVQFTPRGLLIEESRENKLLHSRDMTQAAWSKVDVTPARTQIGLDGVANTACLMTEGSAGTAYLVQSGAAVTAGSILSGSLVLKRGNTDWVQVQVLNNGATAGVYAWFNLNTGTKGAVTAVGGSTNNTSTIQPINGGWYRCSVTTTPDGVYTVGKVAACSATADSSQTRVANATYIVDCAGLEVGAGASSITLTDAATKVRAASNPVMTGTNFSSWFNATEGTFVAEVVLPPTAENGSYPIVLEANDGTTNNRIQIFVAAGASTDVTGMRVDVGGVNQVNTNTVTTVNRGAVMKIAMRYKLNDFAICLNGGALVTDTTGTLPTVTQMQIGRNIGNPNRSIWIRRLAFYPIAMPDATMKALST